MWQIVVIIVLCIIISIVSLYGLNMQPYMNGFWKTPPQYSQSTGQTTVFYIENHIGYIVVADPENVYADHAVNLEFSDWAQRRGDLSEYAFEMGLSPPVDFGSGKKERVTMKIVPSSGKILLQDIDDPKMVYAVLSK
jgi:hypothetical protein